MTNPLRRSVVLLSLLVAACSAQPAPSTPPPSQSSSASPGPSASAPVASASLVPPPSAAASPAPSEEPLAWTQVDPRVKGAWILSDVVATDTGFVAVGADRVTLSAVAMSSPNGRTWTSEAIPGDHQGPSRLARWGTDVIAYGGVDVPCAHPFGLETWVRASDARWTEAPFTDLLCDASMVDVAVVGQEPTLAGTGPGDNAIAWSSTDGLHWVDHSGVWSGLVPQALTTGGTTAVEFGTSSSGLWWSSTVDGATWTKPAPLAGLSGSAVIHGAAWIDGEPTLVATIGATVGTIRANGQGGWTTGPATGLDDATLGSIRQLDGGVVALGGNDTTAMAWVSTDASTWRPVALPAHLSGISAVVVHDGRAVLTGTTTDAGGDAVGQIWTGPAGLLAP